MVETGAWGAGAYREIAFTMLPIVSRLVERAEVRPGERVLDLGCGTATVGIVAAQRGARVTGLDLTPHMLDLAREDVALAGVEMRLEQGDAQKMPFPDGSFDVVLSNMGVIFAPDAGLASAEMLRVLRPGGRLVMTAWTPGGATGAVHQAIDAALGQPSGSSHLRWGDPAFVERTLSSGTEGLTIEREVWERPALSAAHFVEQVARAAPPVASALATLPPEGQRRLRAAIAEAIRPFLRDGVLRSEHLRIVATSPRASDSPR